LLLILSLRGLPVVLLTPVRALTGRAWGALLRRLRALLVLSSLPVQVTTLLRHVRRRSGIRRQLAAFRLIGLLSFISAAALINILRGRCAHAQCKRDRRDAGEMVSPHGMFLSLEFPLVVAPFRLPHRVSSARQKPCRTNA
jgi:hypothetical protein